MRMTLEGCGELYEACKALAGDFRLLAAGGWLEWQGTVSDCLFTGLIRLPRTLLVRDVVAMHDLLLRAHATLTEASGINRREWEA